MNMISIGAFLSALSVALGAFGTHALRGKIGYDRLQPYETGTHYLFIHAIAIVLYGLWRANANRPDLSTWPFRLFLAGSLIFTSSLYVITFTGIREFGAVAPIGGLCFIAAWISFGVQVHRFSKRNTL